MRGAGRAGADWLVARPIAHRGLHDPARGVVENSLAAADAAIASGFAIECDIQRSRDDEALVFHDVTLDRLTRASGRLDAMAARSLSETTFLRGGETIPTFAAFLARVAGQVPVICEIKSGFDGDKRLAERAARIAADYAGPLAFKSFDPDVIAGLRAVLRRPVPLGIVAEARYDEAEWDFLSAGQKNRLINFLHFQETDPDFLSYHVNDLMTAVPYLYRHGMSMPVMAWTIRTEDQRQMAEAGADQIVFEGLRI